MIPWSEAVRKSKSRSPYRKVRSSAALAVILMILLVGCSPQRPATTPPIVPSDTSRFGRAEQFGQFVTVNRLADCKGTKVTIEKVLFDKTNTFMIAAVEGSIRGRIDSMNVDLFDDQGRELGRSSFLHTLPDGKTLLTFKPTYPLPKELKLEFFGGPVGYGDGHVVLTLSDFDFKAVAAQYTKEYRLAESCERLGYRLDLDTITTGISETYLHYQLTTVSDYDGIRHGWFYDWLNNHSPEGEIITLLDDGRKLAPHLSSSNCLGPYYRVAQDNKTLVGKAYFDALLTKKVDLSLTNLYGYYDVDLLIPIDGVTDRLEINKQLSVHGYHLGLKSFAKVDAETWALDYTVLGPGGGETTAKLGAGIFSQDDNYRMPYSGILGQLAGESNRLLIQWQAPPPGHTDLKNLVIKISRLGIPLEDASIQLDLDRVKLLVGTQERDKIMAAIAAYHQTVGQALAAGDLKALEKQYGYLQPTGDRWDGVNDWREKYGHWTLLGVKNYTFALEDPIITEQGNSATVDLRGLERFPHRGIESAGGFTAVYSLEKRSGQWTIIKIDEATEEEFYRQWR